MLSVVYILCLGSTLMMIGGKITQRTEHVTKVTGFSFNTIIRLIRQALLNITNLGNILSLYLNEVVNIWYC